MWVLGWTMTAYRYRASLWGDESVLKLTVLMVAQL